MSKTRKSIKKRFKLTKSGKILRRATNLDHYLAKKPREKKRENKRWVEVHESEAKKIKQLLR